MKYNYFPIDFEDKQKWEDLCPPGEFRVTNSTILHGLLPDELINQYNSVFVMGSATQDGTVYYMANGNRIDYRGNAIDQMPFGFAFIDSKPIGSACLIQHGNWSGRTTIPPGNFWKHLSESNIDNVFPLSEIPSKLSGKITELKEISQHDAFSKLVKKIKSQFLNQRFHKEE